MKNICMILSISLLTGCTVYNEPYDCPIPPGVKCTSVTDLEKMIVETEEGPDIFLGTPKHEDPRMASETKYIWVPDKCAKNSGCYHKLDGSF